MPKLWPLFFILAFVVPQSLQAQVIVQFKVLPAGHDGQVQSVGRARYYLLNEYLKLAEFDSELVKLRLDVQALTDIETGLKKELAAKDEVIRTLTDDKNILLDRTQRLSSSWQKCEKALADSTTVWPYIVGAVGASMGLVGVGIWVGTR